MKFNILAICIIGLPSPIWGNGQALIVIAMHGFSHDFLVQTPHLRGMASSGTWGTILPFLTKDTEPINLSLVTGVYPHQHGVGTNFFHDIHDGVLTKKDKEFFHFDPNLTPLFDVDPDRTYCVNWPGCQFSYNHHEPCKHAKEVRIESVKLKKIK